jgi:hemerythrin-like domain-containing protein
MGVLATVELKKEHETVKRVLNIMERTCKEIETSGKVDTEQLDQLIEFFIVFVDRCHHGKEEDVLIPEMESAGLLKGKIIADDIQTQHIQGRKLITEMKYSISAYKHGDSEALKSFIRHARSYMSLLNPHMERENTDLFWMADQVLSEDTHKKMLARFDVIEKERIGPGRHDEFHKMIEHMEK